MNLQTMPAPRPGLLPGKEELRAICVRAGIDAATTLLYRSVLASPGHGPFVRRVEVIRRRAWAAAWKRDAILVIVPGAFYREHPKSGADGRLLREQAERLGCATDIIPLASTGTLQQNAAIICEWLQSRSSRPVILASLSKGGADVKVALTLSGAERNFAHVAGWINLCGTLSGTPMADWLLSRNLGAVLNRAYYRLRGRSLEFLRDLRYGPGCPLDFELRLPRHLQMISIVGFPLQEHMSNAIARRCHRRLTPLGPNDGGLVLADICGQPGLLYPLWGADHYLRPKTDVRELISAILQYLDEELP
jgi:hypothetical protein